MNNQDSFHILTQVNSWLPLYNVLSLLVFFEVNVIFICFVLRYKVKEFKFRLAVTFHALQNLELVWSSFEPRNITLGDGPRR